MVLFRALECPLPNSIPPTAHYTNLSPPALNTDSVIKLPTQIAHQYLLILPQHFIITAENISDHKRFYTDNEISKRTMKQREI
jgi:hypothetical protein